MRALAGRRPSSAARRLAVGTGALALAASSLAACGRTDEETLTVYAAASLRPVFEQLGKEFEASHEGVQVRFNFAGSSDLAAQIANGAPADVFAAADELSMASAGDDAEDPRIFATNTMAIAVPPDNPAHIEEPADLARPGVRLVVCADLVPCGHAADALSANLRIFWKPVSEEQSVTDVLGKVRSGEADAGIVYVTDVRAAGDAVRGIAVPASQDPVNRYPITVLRGADHELLADEFVDLVLGDAGQRALADAGFGRG